MPDEELSSDRSSHGITDDVGVLARIARLAALPVPAAVDGDRLNRLYVGEPTPTVTGSNADHRVPIKASEVESFARAIAARLGIEQSAAGSMPGGADHYD